MQGRVPISGLCTFQVVAKNGSWTEGPWRPCFPDSWLFLCPSPFSSTLKLLVRLSGSLYLRDPQFSILDSAGSRVCLLSLATLDRSLDQEVVSVAALAVPSLKVSWSGLSGSRV